MSYHIALLCLMVTAQNMHNHVKGHSYHAPKKN